MISWIGMRAVVLIFVLAVFPGRGGLAVTHYAGGLAPSTSRCEIRAVEPPVPGLRVSVIEAGARLQLDNQTGRTIDVLPEPGAARVSEPIVPPGGTARWSDPRVSAAALVADPPEHRRSWAIPLRVGDQPVTIRGEQIWPPPPSAGLWWALTGVATVAATVIGVLAARQRWASAALATATAAIAVAHATHLLGAALVLPPDQPMPATVLGLAGPAMAAWPLAVIAPALAVAGHPSGPMACGLFGALLALFSASDVAGFGYAVLPFAWPASLDRAATMVTVGGGFGLFLAGILTLRTLSRAIPPSRV
jgi:hypothetical protein